MIEENILANSFLGSLLLFLYRTNNITKGNVNKYWKKLHKEEHTLQEIVDFIEEDKQYKMDLSKLVLVSHKDGKYAPLFTGYVEYNGDKYILPISEYKYTGILKHLYEKDVLVHFFDIKSGKWYATAR